jgi:hypothetical protein
MKQEIMSISIKERMDYKTEDIISECPSTEEQKKLSKYDRVIAGKDGHKIIVDVYSVLQAFNITNAATAHAVKKLLAAGSRGYKDIIQDLEEAKASIERAIEMERNK